MSRQEPKANPDLAFFIPPLLLILALALLCACSTAPSKGPSKERLKELLSQCREANRERVRLIKEYRRSMDDCNSETCSPPDKDGVRFCSRTLLNCGHPEQTFGTIETDEAGF